MSLQAVPTRFSREAPDVLKTDKVVAHPPKTDEQAQALLPASAWVNNLYARHRARGISPEHAFEMVQQLWNCVRP